MIRYPFFYITSCLPVGAKRQRSPNQSKACGYVSYYICLFDIIVKIRFSVTRIFAEIAWSPIAATLQRSSGRPDKRPPRTWCAPIRKQQGRRLRLSSACSISPTDSSRMPGPANLSNNSSPLRLRQRKLACQVAALR